MAALVTAHEAAVTFYVLQIKVKSGDDVSLQCQSPRDEAITVLEWSRPEPETDGYVFFVRENRPYESYQHPSFHGRVQLRDPEMKDGDVSVILKNVTINDTGTYKCHVSVNSTELINTTINLKVEDSGEFEVQLLHHRSAVCVYKGVDGEMSDVIRVQ
ncbi:sodium channel subunit beta-3-like [Thunnus maccoyii]|uniref:sodium channel subunit beta-3-like n=1 Tax=Thunnus maccoyii TaxID=8240 RepID=UPI001C4A8456|nr:sodium channel subunit beta-3-like [Thunnus maccoyii]